MKYKGKKLKTNLDNQPDKIIDHLEILIYLCKVEFFFIMLSNSTIEANN